MTLIIQKPTGSKLTLDNGTRPAAIAGVAPTLDYRFARDKREIETVSLADKLTYSGANGTFIGSDGFIQQAGTSPRFNHDAETRQSLGLLIESQSTNSITYSQDLLQSSVWNVNGGTSGVEQYRQSVAPDGGLSFRVYAISPNNPRFTYDYAVSIGETASFYYKAVTSSDVGKTFGFRDDNDALNPFIEIALSADWQRFEYTYTTASNNIGMCFLNGISFSQLTATEVLLWGLQVESASSASSYIPTTNSSVTRSADTAVIDGTGVLVDTYTMVEKPAGCAVVNAGNIELQAGYTAERVMVFPAALSAQQITDTRSAM